jgi:predicted DNA-binding protein (UPF0251 family)
MPRPFNFRRVCHLPQSSFFKPRGIPLSTLQQVLLTVDEFEAVRLADLEGLYQEDAAQRMNISRQTFGRIIDSAHKKIADALVNGKALSIEGGPYELDPRLAQLGQMGGKRFRGGRGGGHCHHGGRGP